MPVHEVEALCESMRLGDELGPSLRTNHEHLLDEVQDLSKRLEVWIVEFPHSGED